MVYPIVSSWAHVNDQTVFMYKEADSDFEYLDTPAGKVEEDETPIEAIFRELKEETGILPHEVDEATAYSPYLTPANERTYFVFPFEIDLKVPPSSVSDEHTETTTKAEEEFQDLHSKGLLPGWKLQNILYIKEAQEHGKKGIEMEEYPAKIDEVKVPTTKIFWSIKCIFQRAQEEDMSWEE